MIIDRIIRQHTGKSIKLLVDSSLILRFLCGEENEYKSIKFIGLGNASILFLAWQLLTKQLFSIYTTAKNHNKSFM
jgi:hypothetical protein